MVGRLFRGPDRDRRGIQLQRLLAVSRSARLHARRLAQRDPRPHLHPALLEVGEDVADRLGHHRRPRVPARVLPCALGDEAQVHPASPPDCAVSDELSAACPCVEGDPRRSGRRELVPLLDRPALARASAVATALQPVRGHARARLHLAAVRRAPDLRLARHTRPATPRGRKRPRREPAARVLGRDAAAVAARRSRGVLLRVHPDARRVRDAVACRRGERLHVRQPDRRSLRDRVSRLGDRVDPRAVPDRGGCDPDGRLLAVPAAGPGGDRVNDPALSKNGARALRVFFGLVVLFLYAPIVILLIFSFNNSAVPTFPLSGFTFHWYHEFLANGDLRAALWTSAIIAALTSVGAVLLGVLSSIALVRRRFRAKALVSALLLSPLVIPYVVFWISLLLLFHTLGVSNGVPTVVIGHIVITLPYTILVLVPRLEQIDESLEEAAYDLGASRLRTFWAITFPLILPAVASAFLIAFTTSFDEYAVASFVIGTRATFPIYLYSALRFPSQLPQVIAVAVVVLVVSLTIVVAAEVGRRWAERRVALET